MTDSNKITMHLEVTDGVQNENSSDYFVSGPVKIFASLDDLSDIYDETEDRCGLYSEYFLNVVKESTLYENNEPIIVFVNNVFDKTAGDFQYQPESLKYRGSYFLFDYETESWQEVLIGTHTHENKEILDKFSEIDLENAENKILSVVSTENGYEFAFVEDNRLPELPGSVLRAIEENNALYGYPNDGIDNHLDGTVVYNSDSHEVYASCNDLYEYMRTRGKYVHLNLVDGRIVLDKENGQILDSFQHIVTDEDIQVSSVFQFTGVSSYADYGFLVYVDGVALNPLFYNIKAEENVIYLKTRPEDTPVGSIVTVLALKNGEISINDLFNAISENHITLDQIRDAAFQVYIDIALNKKKEVPKVYLTNDEDGNIVWENEVLPAQSFYSQTKLLYNSDIEADTTGDHVVVEFENVHFNFTHDFPIILVNQLFAFDAKYFVTGSTNENLTLSIPKNLYFNLDDEDPDRVTLLVVKNTGGEAISAELSRNYVSKKDAVDILSHGKLNLSDYVKISDLQHYAYKAHTHSNFALTGHTHDYRYADYQHTHAEYVTKAALLQALSKMSDLEIVDMSRELVLEINALLANQGFVKLDTIERLLVDNGFFKDNNDNIRLGSNTVYIDTSLIDSELLKKLLYEGENDVRTLEELNLTELTARMLDIFNRDSIEDSKVLVDGDIPVYANVGGITEFDENGFRRIIKNGTNYHDLLTDILNPYIGKGSIERILTPTTALYKFYSDPECRNEIDLSDRPYQTEDVDVYFKFDKFLNTDGRACEYIFRLSNGDSDVVKASICDKTPIVQYDIIGMYDDVEQLDVEEYAPGIYKFTIPTDNNLRLEILSETNCIENVCDNRGNIAVDVIDPVTVSSGDILCSFNKCQIAYAISNTDHPEVFNKSYENVMINLPSSDSVQYLTIAYQKNLREKLDIVHGLMSVLNDFVAIPDYNLEVSDSELNNDEYEFIQLEIYPQTFDILFKIFIDGNSMGTVTSQPAISDAQISQLITKVNMMTEFIEGGDIELSKFELIDVDKISGTICTNKRVPTDNFIIKANYDDSLRFSRFDIEYLGRLNDVLYQYRFSKNRIETSDNYNKIIISVTDDISADVFTYDVPLQEALLYGLVDLSGGSINPNQRTLPPDTQQPYEVFQTYAANKGDKIDHLIVTENAEDGISHVFFIDKDITKNNKIIFKVNGISGGFDLIDEQLRDTLFYNVDVNYDIYVSNHTGLGILEVQILSI